MIGILLFVLDWTYRILRASVWRTRRILGYFGINFFRIILITLLLPVFPIFADNQIELRDNANALFCPIDSGGVFGCLGGPAPTNNACGLSPTIVGNDNAFLVTVGASVGATCTINFGHHWESSTVACVGSDITTGQILTGTPSQDSFTMTGTLVAGDVISMKCANVWTSAPTKGGVYNMTDKTNVIRAWVSSNTIANFPENQESGTSLSVSGCATSPTIAGSSRAMRLHVGDTGVVQPCLILFTNNWDTAPDCITRNNNSALLSTGAATTSGFTISNANTKDDIDIFCEDQVAGP